MQVISAKEGDRPISSSFDLLPHSSMMMQLCQHLVGNVTPSTNSRTRAELDEAFFGILYSRGLQGACAHKRAGSQKQVMVVLIAESTDVDRMLLGDRQ